MCVCVCVCVCRGGDRGLPQRMLGGIIEITSKPQETPCPPHWGGRPIIFHGGRVSWAFLLSHLWELPKVRSQSSLQPGRGQLPYLCLSLTSMHHTPYQRPYSKPGSPSGPFTAGEQVLAGLLGRGVSVNPTSATNSLAV